LLCTVPAETAPPRASYRASSAMTTDGTRAVIEAAGALLEAAVAPLRCFDWVRDFVVPRSRGHDFGVALSLLTAVDVPHTAATLSGIFASRDDCHLSSTFMFVPTMSLGGVTVGLVSERSSTQAGASQGRMQKLVEAIMPECDGPVASEVMCGTTMGRFCYRDTDGSLLIFLRTLPPGRDKSLAVLSELHGNKAVATTTEARDTWQVLIWPSVGDVGNRLCDFMFGVVDAAMFDRALDHGRYADCLLVAHIVGAKVNRVCAECLGSLGVVVGASGVPACTSHALMRPERILHSFRENLRSSHSGVWYGLGDVVCQLPTSFKPAFLAPLALRQEVTNSYLFDDAVDAVWNMRQIAIGRCTAQASLPRQILQLPAAAMVGSSVDAEAVETCVSGDDTRAVSPVATDGEVGTLTGYLPADHCVPRSPPAPPGPCEEMTISLPVLNDAHLTLEPEESVAERRRRKNREAATRANLARKQKNDELKQAVADARKLVVKLLTRQQALREENIALRTLVELHLATER
jgi:hypothetical protein